MALLLATCPASAKVVLPRLFSDGMMLQRESSVNLWGSAEAGSLVKINASWSGAKTVSVRAGADGTWSAKLMTPMAGGPYELKFSDGEATVVSDVMVGDVWLCSGQSNMEMPMEGFKAQPVDGATDELLEAHDDLLRLFTVKRNSAVVEASDVVGQWSHATPDAVRQFSATAYFFGKSIRKATGVPVGLIVCAWGGSSSEAWMKEDWLKAFPEARVPHSKEEVSSKNRNPTVLYKGMLAPIIGYGMRGVIWYQGEDNVPRYKSYAAMQEAMINGWRNEWGIGSFPFYFCQIAPFDYSSIGWSVNSALLREQQCLVERNVENTGMAVLLDAGLRLGIHPRKKAEAGKRLALLALKETYGVDGLPSTARYDHIEVTGDTVRVKFSNSRMWVYIDGEQASSNFEVAGDDHVFHPAMAWVERNVLMVRSADVANPVAVRYAFHNWVVGDLFCNGLPVSSFRSDDWDDSAVDTHAGQEYDVH